MQPQAGQTRLRERIAASHGSMLLTLVSVVQGAVFSYLIYILVTHAPTYSPVAWLLAAITFVVIVVAWNEYFMGITSIVYVPDLLDSFFPFLMAVFQVWLVHAIANDPTGWLLAMFSFSALSSASFVNMYAKGIREPENHGLFAALGMHVYASILLPLIGAPVLLLLRWWVIASATSEASLLAVAIYGVGLIGMFIVRTALYWRRIVAYARGEAVPASDLRMFNLLGMSPAASAGGRQNAAAVL
jgi:hypothetical protein